MADSDAQSVDSDSVVTNIDDLSDLSDDGTVPIPAKPPVSPMPSPAPTAQNRGGGPRPMLITPDQFNKLMGGGSMGSTALLGRAGLEHVLNGKSAAPSAAQPARQAQLVNRIGNKKLIEDDDDDDDDWADEAPKSKSTVASGPAAAAAVKAKDTKDDEEEEEEEEEEEKSVDVDDEDEEEDEASDWDAEVEEEEDDERAVPVADERTQRQPPPASAPAEARKVVAPPAAAAARPAPAAATGTGAAGPKAPMLITPEMLAKLSGGMSSVYTAKALQAVVSGNGASHAEKVRVVKKTGAGYLNGNVASDDDGGGGDGSDSDWGEQSGGDDDDEGAVGRATKKIGAGVASDDKSASSGWASEVSRPKPGASQSSTASDLRSRPSAAAAASGDDEEDDAIDVDDEFASDEDWDAQIDAELDRKQQQRAVRQRGHV